MKHKKELKSAKRPALKKRKRGRRSTLPLAVVRDQRTKAQIAAAVQVALQSSEIRYRRLFESAQDGILILDAGTGTITDVNPYLIKLLGLSADEFVGKKLWEIGLFQDVQKSKSAFKELQRDGYIRYEDLPLETWDGRHIDVEFVSNSYKAGGVRVIQCNIRDITERKHAEVEKAILETIEKEQRRIGQDLHDGLCQQLTGVALIAKALAIKLADKAPSEASEAEEIAQLINHAIDQTRDLARGLSPVEIEAAGLAPALLKFASTIERLYKISCVFNYSDGANFPHAYPPVLATNLYRIAQEAVANAVKHGKAKRVTIALSIGQDRGLLTIQDDGIGFDAALSGHPGLGLRSMHYRGNMIGARLKIRAGVAGGVVVTCSFPYRQETKGLTYEKN
jgi:PAS domain S-box-containing protein